MWRQQRAATQLAWRDFRSAPRIFYLLTLAITLGVAPFAAVLAISNSMGTALEKDARQWLAADLMIYMFDPVTPLQKTSLERLTAQGAEVTGTVENVGHVSRLDGEGAQLMAAVKAVDRQVYPFYGSIGLSTGESLSRALAGNSVVISEDLREQLDVSRGDRIWLNGAEFRVSAILETEPDKFAVPPTPFGRILIDRAWATPLRLGYPGSFAARRILFKLPATMDLAGTRRLLARDFPNLRTVDFREGDERAAELLDALRGFLRFASLATLALAASAAAIVMRAHVMQRVDILAALKLAGARPAQLRVIFLTQAVAIAVCAGALGWGLGLILTGALDRVAPDMIPHGGPYAAPLSHLPVTIGVAILFVLAFVVPGLWSAASLRPMQVLRREYDSGIESASGLRQGALFLGVLAGTGFFAHTWVLWAGAGVAAVIAVAGWVTLTALPRLVRRWPVPATVKYGVANLRRPGSNTVPVICAIAVSTALVISTLLLQQGLTSQALAAVPLWEEANVFVVNLDQARQERFGEAIRGRPEVEKLLAMGPGFLARLIGHNGRKLDLDDPRRWLGFGTDQPPLAGRLIAGEWWHAGLEDGASMALPEGLARQFGIRVGDTMEVEAAGKAMTLRVAAIERSSPLNRVRCCLTISLNQVQGLPASYGAALRVRPRGLAALTSFVRAEEPSASVIETESLVRQLSDWLARVMLVVKIVAILISAGGVLVLWAGIAVSGARRLREFAVLRAAGATRRHLREAVLAEFLTLGVLAASGGAGLGVLVAVGVWRGLGGDSPLMLPPAVILVSFMVASLTIAAAGWVSSRRYMRQRPMAALSRVDY